MEVVHNPGDPDYFIDMSVATDFIAKGLESLGLSLLPKKVIGFSQGGYLAPFLGHRLGNVSQVIGIGCEYLVDEFPPEINFRVDGVHGQQDEIVSFESAKASHQRLKGVAIEGEFHSISGLGHQIDTRVQ